MGKILDRFKGVSGKYGCLFFVRCEVWFKGFEVRS